MKRFIFIGTILFIFIALLSFHLLLRGTPTGICDVYQAQSFTVSPAGKNFALSPDTEVEVIGGRPAIASDGTNFFLVWQNSSSSMIYGTRVSHGGTILDPSGILIASAFNTPSVIFDGTNYFVIWVNGEIYGARVSPDGSVLDPSPLQLTTNGNPKDRPISLAFDGTNYLISWRTHSDRIYGLRVNSSGVPLDSPAGFEIGTGFYPWVAFDGTNHLIVWHKWGNGLDIYGARVSTDGTVLDPGGFGICTEDDDQDGTSVAFGDTNYLVVWHDFRPGNEYNGTAYGARVSIDGTVLDVPPIKISDYVYRDSPVVIAFDGSDYLVVWHEDNAQINFRNFDVFGRRVSTGGAILDQKGIPIGIAHNHQFGPRVAFDNNTYLVGWNESPGRGTNPCVFGQILQKVSNTGNNIFQFASNWSQNSFSSKPDTIDKSSNLWNPVASPTDQAITDIFGLDSDHIYATCALVSGTDVDVIQYDGNDWSVWTTVPRGRMYGIWASDPQNVWDIGWCWAISHYNGSTWSPPDCYGDGIGMGLWGTDSTNIWAVGVRNDCLNYNGTSWESNPAGLELDLWDVWGSAFDNVYAVGEFGTMIHYNGSSWSAPLDVPTHQNLNALWGSGANNIFSVGDFGTILHYNGLSWTSQDSGTTEHLIGIWGLNSSHVYAVGINGTILHYDGTSWSQESSGTEHYLSDVWGFENTIWAVGNHGTILKKVLPSPDVKANGSDGPITITKADSLSITAGLDSGTYSGENADWWLLTKTKSGWFYYDIANGWTPGKDVTHQGKLRDISAKTILNETGLPAGVYVFYFGIDLAMNGSIDKEKTYYDRIRVTINP